MAAKRKPAQTPEPEVIEAEPTMTWTAEYLSQNLTAKPSTTVDQLKVRESLLRKLVAVDAMIADFIAEKTAEGFSLEDISQLYALETSIVPLVAIAVDGRAGVEFEARIVERVDD